MTNGQIIDLIETTASLLELHDENAFKVKSLQSAVFNLDKVASPLFEMNQEELAALEGIGKGIASKITEIIQHGTTQELEMLMSMTPPGVVDMLGVKGVGPKKVRTIWKELQVEDLLGLQKACIENRLASIKGFGEKTQRAVLQSLEFMLSNQGKFLYSNIEDFAIRLEAELKAMNVAAQISLSGDVRRKMEIVSCVQLILGSDNTAETVSLLDQFQWLEKNKQTSGPFVWRGKDKVLDASVEIKIYPVKDFASQLYLHSAGKQHLLSEAKEGQTFIHYLRENNFSAEPEIFSALEMQEIPVELREGFKEIQLAKEKALPKLLEETDLKGILHNHTNYSDGKNTLEEMASFCKEEGYHYLGISDHSKTATYANGLQEFRVKKQHEEIDALNKKLGPFKIFKGIESDILTDGALDYDDTVLKSFDFIVASIHSGFAMDEAKATQRLITAIENPYTTILGHMTGRILLRREGYPVNHKKIIDACGDNKVIIEINSNPHRLDIDWRWVDYCLDKGVLLSINPDAHVREGLLDMKYGVNVGRKGGLTADMTFNSWPIEKVEAWFKEKRK